jgi:uncharacterized membrane protein YjjP (DUF1212 family)
MTIGIAIQKTTDTGTGNKPLNLRIRNMKYKIPPIIMLLIGVFFLLIIGLFGGNWLDGMLCLLVFILAGIIEMAYVSKDKNNGVK